MVSGLVETFFFSVTENDQDKRIDTFLASRLKEITRSRIQGLIRQKHITVNDSSQKTSYKIKAGDSIRVSIPASEPYHIKPEPVQFSIVYEDSSLIVINKPPGLVIHPAPGHSSGTLVHGLLNHCKDLSGIGGVLRPGIVHRLDKDTSGLMVVAKNDSAHAFLSNQFKQGKVNKEYRALVHGIVKGDKGEINLPISRHPKRRKEMAVAQHRGKEALTIWEKMEEIAGNFSLLKVTLKTGRTHQIRVHLSNLGHPVVGDSVYGIKTSRLKKTLPDGMDTLRYIKRQMLHAAYLGFLYPTDGKYIEFHAPIPEDMTKLINHLRMKNNKNNKT